MYERSKVCILTAAIHADFITVGSSFQVSAKMAKPFSQDYLDIVIRLFDKRD